MKKIIIAPDSFKGSMSAARVCEIVSTAFYGEFPGIDIVSVPAADGGEGTVSAFYAAAGGRLVGLRVTGPNFEPVWAEYLFLPDEKTAVIELASAAGLPLAGENPSPLRTTTLGVGELMAHAAESGAENIILGLGGSATHDFATGAAHALGAKFYRADGSEFVPTGGTLADVARIDPEGLKRRLKGVAVTAMCDIQNPLCGPAGAAYVFAPQKGAAPEELPALDAGTLHMGRLCARPAGRDVTDLPGAGAAGGAGGGAAVFFGADLLPGADLLLDAAGFDKLLAGACLVITGEGRFDSQSAGGKLPAKVLERAHAAGVPALVIAGDIPLSRLPEEWGNPILMSTNRRAVDFSVAKLTCEEDLAAAAQTAARLLRLGAGPA